MSAGKTAKEEPLFPAHEQRTPENHPRTGRGLRRGERELRQRAQTQRGHHSPEVIQTLKDVNMHRLGAFETNLLVDSGFDDVLSLAGGSRPVPAQPWHRWSSARRLRGRLLPSLTSSSTAASESSSHESSVVKHHIELSSLTLLLDSLLRAASGSTWSKMVKEEPVIDYFDVQD